jgi:hypothetical protein
MLQQPEKPDISFMVDYRRRLGRASLAGTTYGVIVFFRVRFHCFLSR